MITAILLLIFTICYTWAIQRCDVQAIGPMDTRVGFATINKAVQEATGFNERLYKITQIMGLATFAIAGLFALLGLVQLIRRKSLLKVDKSFIALAGLYVMLAGLYAAFEIFIVNYRPIIMPGETEPEASFPSSHTMLACGVMGSAVVMIGQYVKNKALRWFLQFICIVLMLGIVAGRLFSGVHWLTDIIGGILIGSVLVTFFSGIVFKGRK